MNVNFEKAYDNVDWGFLKYILTRSGFGANWVRCMLACVYNSTTSVLVNGSPTSDFALEKGLKQGDLLSPFLFILVADGLSMMVPKAAASGALKGFRVNEKLAFDLL